MRLWRIRLVLVWFGLDCGVFGGGFGVRCGFVAKSRDVGGGWDDELRSGLSGNDVFE